MILDNIISVDKTKMLMFKKKNKCIDKLPEG